ncbi:MAG: hypothetical protein JWQ11_3991 [Rhizobacter sp.]|nr:hypothetical protein [Rhizobacter sp.]
MNPIFHKNSAVYLATVAVAIAGALASPMVMAADTTTPVAHRYPAHQTADQASRLGVEGEATAPENLPRQAHGKTHFAATKVAGVAAEKSHDTVLGEATSPTVDGKLPRGHSSFAALRSAGVAAEKSGDTVLGEKGSDD